MTKSALLTFATVLIGGTAMAAPHPAVFAHKPTHILISAAPPGSKTLYDQNKDDAGLSIFSQNLDNTQGADDFVVPAGHTWQIKEVDVTGAYFRGSSAAKSENVFFYSDNHGLPGDLVVACPNQNGTDNGQGSFAIALSNTCKVKLDGSAAMQAGKSKGTTYWVSVQVNVIFGLADGWGWELSTDTTGHQGAWQNPNGFVCPTWGTLKKCTGIAHGFMFALRGKDKH